MDDQGKRQQRLDALRLANDARFYRATLRKRMKARQVTKPEVVSLILAPPRPLHSMTVAKFLRALPHVGVVKSNAIIKRLKLPSNIALGHLTDGQREQLASFVSALAMIPAKLPSDQPDQQEVNNGDNATRSNHNRPQRSAA